MTQQTKHHFCHTLEWTPVTVINFWAAAPKLHLLQFDFKSISVKGKKFMDAIKIMSEQVFTALFGVLFDAYIPYLVLLILKARGYLAWL